MLRDSDRYFEPLESRKLLATFLVDTGLDVIDAADGFTSLREAIIAANDSPGRDEIRFVPFLSETEDIPTLNLALGQLEITDEVDILGPGPDLLAIDAGGLSRVFRVSIGDLDDVRGILIEGLTLRNGSSGAQPGGAIFSYENLTLRRCAVVGNVGWSGGGIEVTLADRLHVEDCLIEGNSATTGSGGGINAWDISVTIVNSSIIGNSSADRWGGGVMVAGELAVVGSVVAGNTAWEAGGIWARGNVEVRDSTIKENVSTDRAGGGLYVSNVEKATLVIERSEFHDNSSPYGGGALAASNVDATITDSLFVGNSGSGVSISRDARIERTVFRANTSAGFAGGLYHFQGTLELIDCEFDGNHAVLYGGGVSVGIGSEAVIRGSLFRGNTAGGDGGGLFLSSGSTLLINSTVTGNRAGGNGGGVVARNSTIANSTIVHNVADTNNSSGFRGGGVYLAQFSGQEHNNRLYSSIVAMNTRTTEGIDDQLSRDPADAAHNLIGGDPLIAPLADYGGPTFTHALHPGSPAIDAGSNPQNLDTDARGNARVFGAAADIGAFEHNGPPVVTSLTPSVTPVGLPDSFTLTAIIADPGDAPIVEVRFYHDANRNGVPDDGELLSTDTDASDGWTASVGPFPGAGPAETFIAVAADALGFSSDGFAADVAFDSSNERPFVQSFVVSAGTVERGASFTLAATAVDADGTIVEVRFIALFDLNGDGVVDANDTITDSDASNGFTAVVSAAASSRIPIGEPARFRIVAVDNVGAPSDPAEFEFDPRLSRFVRNAARVNVTTDSGDAHRIVGVNLDGRVFVFEPTETGWRVREASAGEPNIFTGPSTTWTDLNDGLTYAAAVTDDGLVLLRLGLDGEWTVRILTSELAGSIAPDRLLTHFISTDGIVVLVGVAQDRRMVAFQQTVAADGAGNPLWTFVNISDDHLTPQGMATPDLNDLIAYVTNWNAWHLAGIDADGNIQSVWIMPGAFDLWRVDNLSEITGAPLISGQLAVTLTSWDGINLAGLNADGRLMVTWWVPQFGGDWLTNDLTENADGPLMAPGQLTGYTTPWGGLNYAGLDAEGELTVYWWTPTLDLWVVSPLIEGHAKGAVRPAGTLASHASMAGTLNILGVGPGGEVIRVHWAPGMDSWISENLSEVAVHA